MVLEIDSDIVIFSLFSCPVSTYNVISDFFHSFTGNHLSIRFPHSLTLPLTEKLCITRVMIVIKSHAHAFITVVIWVSNTGNTFH